MTVETLLVHISKDIFMVKSGLTLSGEQNGMKTQKIRPRRGRPTGSTTGNDSWHLCVQLP